MKVLFGLIPLLALMLAGLPGCRPAPSEKPAASPTGLNVVTTTSMVGDLVRRIAGDRAQVTALIGEGIDPHLYRPTSSDVGKMMKSDILFYSGLGLEGAMQSAFENASKRGRTVVAVTDQLPKERLRHPSEFAGHPDPHVWHDPTLWMLCLDRIVEVLSEKDPANAAGYQERAKEYREELRQLDEYARQLIETIPKGSRTLVTAHDAFEYFAATYGLTVRSVQGISTDSEPGIQDINNLVDYLVQHRIPAFFTEATINPDSLKAVMERCVQKGWQVRTGGTLYSDSMGTPGSYEGTYPGMIEHNVTTIVRALQGTVPEGGFQKFKNTVPAATSK